MVGVPRIKVIFVVTEDWYFVSHRLDIAIGAKAAGFDVGVATRIDRHRAAIQNAGIEIYDTPFDRSGLNPLRELRTVWSLYKLFRREKPDIVHQVAIKPVVYGSLIARLSGVSGIVNALGGLGYVFSSTSLKARLIRLLVKPALKFAHSQKKARLILQNAQDVDIITKSGIVKSEKVRLIRGAGVDPEIHRLTTVETTPPLVVLTARLLRQKGVGDFVEAARILRKRSVDARFVLVGSVDAANPASFTDADVAGWVKEGVVEAWGWREDMPAIFAKAQIACLPTFYGEGLPKALLEAAASGCAIVASNIAACTELVKDEKTGLVVPPQDTEALANALERLISDPGLRKRLGEAARESIVADFSLSKVLSEIIGIYEELVPSAAP
jgi:glycosyltransferase involved in cell wall biosynthesis